MPTNTNKFMKKLKFKFDKLVRDELPQKMKNEGIVLHYSRLNDNALLSSLKQKLIEEANEVAESVAYHEIVAELADILDIVDAICESAKIEKQDIEANRKQKFNERGGFKLGVFAHSIEADATSETARYCLSIPERYPQID